MDSGLSVAYFVRHRLPFVYLCREFRAAVLFEHHGHHLDKIECNPRIWCSRKSTAALSTTKLHVTIHVFQLLLLLS